MKKIFVFCFSASLLINMKSSLAQSPHYNHQTIHVIDIEKSVNFYEHIMELEKIPEPFHDNKHVWLKVSEHGQLHIVSGAKEIMPHDINIHLAFSVSSVKDFSKRLDSMNIKYGNWEQTSKAPQIRPDGIEQIYFQDPDGYWIEVNNDHF